MHGCCRPSTFLFAGDRRTTTTIAETEVDDVDSTLMCRTHPTAPALASAVRERYGIAPDLAAQGTAVPFGFFVAAAGPASAAAVAVAQVAVAGVRSTDLPGSPPRGAPV